MPKQMTKEERAAYQRQYRERKKALDLKHVAGQPNVFEDPDTPPPLITVTEFANEDRQAGLPRTNYYSDYRKIIPAMSQQDRDRILNRINKQAK